MDGWEDHIDRARNGDREALGTVFRRCRPGVRSFVCHYVRTPLKNGVEIDDLVQKTLLRALRAFSKFRGKTEASLHAWFRTIARHVVLDERRKPQPALVPLPEDPPAGGGTGHGTRERREDRRKALEQALRRLAPDHYKVIVLVYLHYIPIKRVAELMKRRPEATYELLSRARKKLKLAFGNTNGSLILPPDCRLADESVGEEAEDRAP